MLCRAAGGDDAAAEGGRLEDGKSHRETSPLVSHVDGDPFCPCPAPSCAGGVVSSAFWRRMPMTIAVMVPDVMTTVALAWTALVTLAPRTWTSPWAALLGALYVAVALPYYTQPHIKVSIVTPLLELAHRLRHRAAHLLLSDFLSRCRAGTAPDPSVAEPYVRLHDLLAAMWRSQSDHASHGRGFVAALLVTAALAGIASAGAGSCVPAWVLFAYACYFTLFFRDLLAIAAANASVDSVAGLYAQARRELRRLALSGSPRAEHLRDHEAQLALLADLGSARGRWMGFGVTYGTARAFAATAFTVALGLWTLLRGTGIVFTMDNVCPAR